MQAQNQIGTQNFNAADAFAAEPKFRVGKTYKMRCYPERTLEITAARWVGFWEYDSSWNGVVVNTYCEEKLEMLMLPEVPQGQCVVVPGYTSSDAVVVTHDKAFKVFYILRTKKWRGPACMDAATEMLIDPFVQAHFSAIPIMTYVPMAEYEIGCCHYGHKIPYKTVKIKADSKSEAMDRARKLLEPSTVEHIVHVETRPNPDRMTMTNIPNAIH